MKKILFIFAAIAFLLSATVHVQAQTLTNDTRKVITVKSSDNSYELPSIAPHRSMSAPFLKEGENSVILYYFEGMREVKVGTVNVNVKNGKGSISDSDLKPSQSSKPASSAKKEAAFTSGAVSASIFTTQLTIENNSSHSIIILSGPFAGLALAPGQKSDSPVTYPLGQDNVIVKIDFVNDSSDHNKGRKFRQVVLSKIITKDQKVLKVVDGDLTEMGGKTLWRRVQNNFAPFQFVSGPWANDALGLGEVSQKAQMQKGFNSFAVQWVTSDGIKWQADAELLVTSRTKIIKINEAMLRNKMMVKQY